MVSHMMWGTLLICYDVNIRGMKQSVLIIYIRILIGRWHHCHLFPVLGIFAAKLSKSSFLASLVLKPHLKRMKRDSCTSKYRQHFQNFFTLLILNFQPVFLIISTISFGWIKEFSAIRIFYNTKILINSRDVSKK